MSLPRPHVQTIAFLFLMQLVPFAAITLAQPPRPLRFRTIALNGDRRGTLAVVDGQPRLVDSPSAWNEWTLHETQKGWTIQERPSPEATPQSRYLSIDKEGRVILVAEPSDGAYWKLTPDVKRLSSFDTTIQATAGNFKDWHLSFGDRPEEIEKGQYKYQAYRITLSEKPGPRTNLHIFIDGP